MSKAVIIRATPLVLILTLGACDDRLDGRDQPNPFAEEDAPTVEPQSRPAPAIAPEMTDQESAEADPNEEVVDGFGSEEDFDDGPFDPSGFDPAPIDDASGFDPSPVDLDGGFGDDFADDEG